MNRRSRLLLLPTAVAAFGGILHAAGETPQAVEPAPVPPPSFAGGGSDTGRERHALALPNEPYWQARDLLSEIQAMMRRGPVPVTRVGAEVKALDDFASLPKWKIYGFTVPARGTLQVRLQHPNDGWFRLLACDERGRPIAGTDPNPVLAVHTALTYRNPSDEARTVFVVADDPGSMSSGKRPYKLVIERGTGSAEAGQAAR